MSINRAYSGKIVYTGPQGVRGREHFSINVREGGRTVRAYCEIYEDGLERDASWTLDQNWEPVEGHVRCILGGRLAGSSWYRFTDTHVECESLTDGCGRISQQLPGKRSYLGLHPLIGDGLVAAARGTDAPGVERHIESVTCSYSTNGEVGLLALPISIGVTYVGEEAVTVPAGTFHARHFKIRWQPHWPAADLWVFGDDYIFLKLSWEISKTTSELVSLDYVTAAV